VIKIRKNQEDYLRSVLFGCEDGLVSTTGAVVGIAAGSADKEVVVLAGLVVIAVEALSMGAGQFLSEKAVHQLNPGSHRDNIIMGALLMFAAYSLAGLIPLAPYLLWPLATAVPASLILALLALFGLGYAKGRLIKVPPVKSGLEILIVGGLAAVLGLLLGLLLKL
jgi:vacuolar iron transporter family protein